MRYALIAALFAAAVVQFLLAMGLHLSWQLGFAIGAIVGVATVKLLRRHDMRYRKGPPAKQLELLQQFVTRGQNAQRAADKVIRDFQTPLVNEDREQRDRRLEELHTSRTSSGARRRGRADG